MLKKLAMFTAVSAILLNSSPVTFAADEQKERPTMDLAFCIDTTGSMSSEIDVVKAKTKELVAKLSSTKPSPNIRVGLVAYRDRGDSYVTKVFQFTGDIDKIVKDISALSAQGGGDSEEAVDEALHTAVNQLAWSTDKKAVKLLFLIGDAGPHANAHYNWLAESKNAIGKGIQINTIACEGLQNFSPALGTEVFQKIAKVTDGKYETLAYRQEIAGADGKKETLISSGGATYRMKSSDASAWRGGVGSLAAKGLAEPVASAPALGASLKTGTFARATRGGAATLEAASFADSAAPVSRADNNLADILLQGAREAARKSAK
jgi:hypothetical protein